MKIHVHHEGDKLGPLTVDEVRALVIAHKCKVASTGKRNREMMNLEYNSKPKVVAPRHAPHCIW